MKKQFIHLPNSHKKGWAKSTASVYGITEEQALKALIAENPICSMYGDNYEYSVWWDDAERDRVSKNMEKRFGEPEFKKILREEGITNC